MNVNLTERCAIVFLNSAEITVLIFCYPVVNRDPFQEMFMKLLEWYNTASQFIVS
ncbi:hypothetical protein Q4Q35_01280 [Flavivirga aquimarina]|uniref:Uncharacterized protein n=1 Tax=Flavivirga aquimarina TaxID=2027862 RepID=A0ABT8W5P0_9FLAO|nr:hypothetical protein [Flavivirga aquimarina]MDO5968429.1 hypothetical protein [Flavivirga aquimarina]